MTNAFYAVLRRDLMVAARRRSDWLNPLVFYVIVVTLFPLGIGPDGDLLRQIAPGVLWVAALLATLLATEGLFRSDFDDGSLEQLVISGQPLTADNLRTHQVPGGQPKMTSIEDRVKKIVVEQLGVKDEEVTSAASFVDDLGADSLDTVELVMALEEEFECEIPDEEAEKITTVQQAVDYVNANLG